MFCRVAKLEWLAGTFNAGWLILMGFTTYS